MGIVLSRGPTGSHWGPDANAVSGQWTRPINDNGSYGYNAFATAADFYDACAAINHHPEYIRSSQAWSPTLDGAEFDKAIDLLQEIGIRHIRSGMYNPSNHSDTGYQNRSGVFSVRLRQRSRNRNKATTQPIFQNLGTVEDPNWMARKYGGPWNYPVTNPGTAQNSSAWWLRSLDGPPGPNNAAGYNPGGGGGGNYQDIGWEGASSLQGPNEPRNQYSPEPEIASEMRALYQKMKAAKNARTTEIVLDGEDYIDFDTGRITKGPARAPQIPVFGFGGIQGNELGYRYFGDYVGTKDIDIGAPHMYWGGHEPWFGPTSTGSTGAWANWGQIHNNQFSQWESYNGALNTTVAPTGRFNRTLPMVVTETGYYTWPNQGPSDQTCVPDVAAEYLIRTMIQNYIGGIKRTYWYKLYHEGGRDGAGNYNGPPAMGVCDNTAGATPVRLAPFYAFKNLLKRIGWREPVTKTPITVGIETRNGAGPTYDAGWVPGPTNKITGDSAFDTSSPDRLDKLIIQTGDVASGASGREYLIFLSRNRTIWQRNPRTRAIVTDPKYLRVTLPAGNWRAFVSEPAKNPAGGGSGRTGAGGTPNDGQTYSNLTDGLAEVELVINSSNQVENFLVAGLTRVVRIVEQSATTPPPKPTITSPANNSTTTDQTPAFSGGCRNLAGDDNMIKLEARGGTNAFGPLIASATFNRNAGGTTWTVANFPTTLEPGHYTFVAKQSNAADVEGVSDPVTIEIISSTGDDALVLRVKRDLSEFTDWCRTNGVAGVIGEFGVPGNPFSENQAGQSTFVPGDEPKWAALAEKYYDALVAANMPSIQWAASQVFKTYELSPYVSSGGAGSPLNIVNASAAPLENHKNDPPFRGLAVVGLEFGERNPNGFSNVDLGILGQDFFDEQDLSWQFVGDRGIKYATCSFRWERMQPVLGGPLDITTNYANPPHNNPGKPLGYLNLLKQQVARAGARNIKVAIDCQNQGSYYMAPGFPDPSAEKFINGGTVTYDHYVDFWVKMATEFVDNDNVFAYILGNEPRGLPAGAWKEATKRAYNAIRLIDPDTEIWVPGDEWSTVQHWASTNGAPWIPGATNLRYEAHHYFDTESSPNGPSNSEYGDTTYAQSVSDSAGVVIVPPTVTIASPITNANLLNATFSVTGTAGNASGDATTIPIKIFQGTTTTGTPYKTFTGTRTGTSTSWSASVNQPLPNGQYTIVANQTNSVTGLTSANVTRLVNVNVARPAINVLQPVSGSTVTDPQPQLIGTAEVRPGVSTNVDLTIVRISDSQVMWTGSVPIVQSPTNPLYKLWVGTVGVTLANGNYALGVSQQDAVNPSLPGSALRPFSVSAVSNPPPVVTVNDVPDEINDFTPDVRGTASTRSGDQPNVIVRLYSGTTATGTPLQTRNVPITGNLWFATFAPVPGVGDYTVTASQQNATDLTTGTSVPETFAVAEVPVGPPVPPPDTNIPDKAPEYPSMGKPPQPPVRPSWKFILGDSYSMAPKGELRAKNKSIQMALNKPGSLTCSISMTDDLAEEVKVDTCCIMAYRENVLLWSGPITTIEEDGNNNSMSISAIGWFDRLNHRLLRHDKTFTNTPGGQIAMDLLNLANTQKTGAISEANPEGTGFIIPTNISPGAMTDDQTRTITYTRWQNIGEAITQLTEIENGFDMFIHPQTRQLHIFKVNTFLRRDRPEAQLGYNWGPNNVQTFGRQIDASTIVTNIHATGTYVTETASAHSQALVYGLREEHHSLSEVKNQEVLGAFVNGELAVRAFPRVTYSVQPFPIPIDQDHHIPEPFVDYGIGDIIYLSAIHGARINIKQQAVRVFGMNVTIDEEGNEKLGPLQLSPQG